MASRGLGGFGQDRRARRASWELLYRECVGWRSESIPRKQHPGAGLSRCLLGRRSSEGGNGRFNRRLSANRRCLVLWFPDGGRRDEGIASGEKAVSTGDRRRLQWPLKALPGAERQLSEFQN